jgi:hypothetical protein
MKRTFLIPAILVAGLGGLGGAAYAASAFDDLQPALEGAAGYNWSAQRWRDDDRRDDDRGPRWRRGDDDDRRGYGPREGRRGDDDCGPGMGRGRGHGEHGWRYHGRGYDGDRGEGRGYGWREGRGFDRDDDRGYRGHGYHHRHEGRGEGRGGPRFGRGFDPARLDSVKREIGVTAAQEQAWTKYADTLKEVSEARKARRDSMDRSAIAKMSTDEFRKFRDAMIEQRRKEQDQVRAAVDGLVASLDEKQVAVAKEVLPGYAFGRMSMGGMGMGGMGMGGMGMGGMGMGRNR